MGAPSLSVLQDKGGSSDEWWVIKDSPKIPTLAQTARMGHPLQDFGTVREEIMNRRIVKTGLGILFVGALGVAVGLRPGPPAEKRKDPAWPPASIPTFSTENIGREGFFYVGGK